MVENKFIRKVAEEWVLFLSSIGLILTSIYLNRTPLYNTTDFKVIYTLFIFLIIIKGLERTGFFTILSDKIKKDKYLSRKLILLTAILSMFVTNDVALLTMVPWTLTLDIENIETLIIFETLTANIVSSLTPFGNPQNIFIYYHFHLHPLVFIKTIAPFTIILFLIIFFISSKYNNIKVSNSPDNSEKINKTSYIYIGLFILFILAILKILPLEIGISAILYSFVFDRKSLKIDYFLLLTFLAFFGFTDNLINILKISLSSSNHVFLFSAFGSQLISNVPGALFFADFTNHWKPLLWGVSVGGLGNIIGSLASLISYRLYKVKFKRTKIFLIKFHIYGYLFFILGIIVYFIFEVLL
jgi:Na+/H+ antiporter NhaD/arsenite permease-like protein